MEARLDSTHHKVYELDKSSIYRCVPIIHFHGSFECGSDADFDLAMTIHHMERVSSCVRLCPVKVLFRQCLLCHWHLYPTVCGCC